MKIFGKETSRDEILKKTGDITQLGGIKQYEFIDGVSRGMRAIDIKSPCGLDMTILPDRGMDISNLSYKSIPMNWKSATRETSPTYFEDRGFQWLRTFYGGLVLTCGLTTMGMPSTDNGEELGLHGRISNISAENVFADGRWENDNYVMTVRGKVREAAVFKEKLQLERKITTWMDTPRVVMEDVVENIGHETSPLMILYHVNIGYPVLDIGAELLESSAKIEPRDDEARDGEKDFNKFIEPVRGYKEKVYFHDIEADSEGNSNVAIVNEGFSGGKGIGIWLKFNKNNLPFMTQWKQMGMGDYACGIEPVNSFPRGRKIEREEGTLKFIEPGEKIRYRLEFNILKSNKDIEQFKSKFCR